MQSSTGNRELRRDPNVLEIALLVYQMIFSRRHDLRERDYDAILRAELQCMYAIRTDAKWRFRFPDDLSIVSFVYI